MAAAVACCEVEGPASAFVGSGAMAALGKGALMAGRSALSTSAQDSSLAAFLSDRSVDVAHSPCTLGMQVPQQAEEQSSS